jgi:hypothetical protein
VKLEIRKNKTPTTAHRLLSTSLNDLVLKAVPWPADPLKKPLLCLSAANLTLTRGQARKQ